MQTAFGPLRLNMARRWAHEVARSYGWKHHRLEIEIGEDGRTWCLLFPIGLSVFSDLYPWERWPL